MERRPGPDFGLSMRMAAAVLCLGGDPIPAAVPVAVAWIAGVVLGVQGAGRAAGASGMGFAVGALTLLLGPWVLGIVGFFVVFLLGSAGGGPF